MASMMLVQQGVGDIDIVFDRRKKMPSFLACWIFVGFSCFGREKEGRALFVWREVAWRSKRSNETMVPAGHRRPT
jgi:hypothetical protein